VLWLDPERRRGIVRITADGVHATAAEWSAAALDATRVPRAVAV